MTSCCLVHPNIRASCAGRPRRPTPAGRVVDSRRVDCHGPSPQPASIENYPLAQYVLLGLIEPLPIRNNLRLAARRYGTAAKKQIRFTAQSRRFRK
jgi:hypothetical protein